MKTYGTLKSAVAEINKLQVQLAQHKKYARKASNALHIERIVFKASYFAIQKQKLLMHTIYLAIIATLLFIVAGAK